ncbi:hypothetical protein JOF48_000352 [Arthrobacter stackebrandtii]|uniref:Glycosyl transferase family 1 domain-containing protein n=1 Tax=Arthrobacter stackebrandtii TaxID=272161 RepID=A0ABS4YUC4_9MICC|nr:glycosyltransferase [Arthrobacter stackebrandtii]MBP2411553.1 hypothetical protein [Arthrobacter stackebrandtii]
MKAREAVRKSVAAYQNWSDLRWRKPPRLHVGAAAGDPAVYYLAPMETKPSGGVKVIYQHVDALRDLGIRAAVLHAKEGFRCDWFENQTPVVSAATVKLKANDILAVPECYGPTLHLFPPEVRKVVFNQGPHHTFDRIPFTDTAAGHPYRTAGNLAALLTVSRDGAELLKYAFDPLPVGVVRNVVDGRVFTTRTGPAPRRIAYMPSRRPEELHQLRHLLRAVGVGMPGGWELLEIANMDESQVAAAMRSSAIFLSLSERDGFGLPPAEAMASGAYVVGYAGGGGREFFDPSYCTPAVDTTTLLRGLLDAMDMPDAEREERGLKASAAILNHYTADGLRADLETFYGEVL